MTISRRSLRASGRKLWPLLLAALAFGIVRDAVPGPQAATAVTDAVTGERIGELTYGVSPARILDTRNAATVDLQYMNLGKQLRTAQPLVVSVRGRAGVPASATGVFINVTATEAAGNGYLTVWPDGGQPGTSTLNFSNGQTVANFAFVAIGSDGAIRLKVNEGDAHLMVDVVAFTSDLPTI